MDFLIAATGSKLPGLGYGIGDAVDGQKRAASKSRCVIGIW